MGPVAYLAFYFVGFVVVAIREPIMQRFCFVGLLVFYAFAGVMWQLEHYWPTSPQMINEFWREMIFLLIFNLVGALAGLFARKQIEVFQKRKQTLESKPV